MSGIPIKKCRFSKAVDSPQAFDELVRDMAYNLANKLYYEITPCDHSPVCRVLTEEEFLAIKNRVSVAVSKEFLKPNARYL